MLIWGAILLLSHLMCFSLLKNLFSTSSIASQQISLLSRFLSLTSTTSRQIGWSIEPKSCALYLLNTTLTDSQSIEVGFFSIDSQHLLNRSRYPCMHFIFLCFAFFSFMSIASCFSFSSRSIVPCSPCSLYISFLFVSGQVFLAFYALWQLCQKVGDFFRIECHSSEGVIDLRGELQVNGKKVFDVTNLGGELVWYTLILIYIFCCVSFGFVTIYIHHVLFLYLMMTYVFYSLSHMCCFFSLFIHMFLFYLTCHNFPHGTLMCFV